MSIEKEVSIPDIGETNTCTNKWRMCLWFIVKKLIMSAISLQELQAKESFLIKHTEKTC